MNTTEFINCSHLYAFWVTNMNVIVQMNTDIVLYLLITRILLSPDHVDYRELDRCPLVHRINLDYINAYQKVRLYFFPIFRVPVLRVRNGLVGELIQLCEKCHGG